jgi:hypothetical protein
MLAQLEVKEINSRTSTDFQGPVLEFIDHLHTTMSLPDDKILHNLKLALTPQASLSSERNKKNYYIHIWHYLLCMYFDCKKSHFCFISGYQLIVQTISW